MTKAIDLGWAVARLDKNGRLDLLTPVNEFGEGGGILPPQNIQVGGLAGLRALADLLAPYATHAKAHSRHYEALSRIAGQEAKNPVRFAQLALAPSEADSETERGWVADMAAAGAALPSK